MDPLLAIPLFDVRGGGARAAERPDEGSAGEEEDSRVSSESENSSAIYEDSLGPASDDDIEILKF